MGGVVSAPCRACDTAPCADATGAVDMGCRCRSRRPIVRQAPDSHRPRVANPFSSQLAGLPTDRRAACARGMAWPDRSERCPTHGTGPLPLSRRARRSRCETTAAAAASLPAAPATDGAAHIGGDSRKRRFQPNGAHHAEATPQLRRTSPSRGDRICTCDRAALQPKEGLAFNSAPPYNPCTRSRRAS